MTAGQGTAALLTDRDYLDVVHASVEDARRRVWACLFIYDVRPERDVRGDVLALTMALVARSQRGVDVRVLLAGDIETRDIAAANLTTGLFLREHGVPVRQVYGGQAEGRSGTHAKFLVCDDTAVVGSQNWADDAFADNVEDAVLLAGPPVGLVAAEFLRLWAVGRGLPGDDAR